MVLASEGERGVLSDAGKDKDRRSLLERQENVGKTPTLLTHQSSLGRKGAPTYSLVPYGKGTREQSPLKHRRGCKV